MNIEIFDIDGTLTHDYSDRPLPDYQTYEYWTLINRHFTTDIVALESLIKDWEKALAVGENPIACTHHLMHEALQILVKQTTARSVREYSKELTLQFIQHGLIQKIGIEHLNKRVNAGVLCILATAGYEDGALGFLDGLVAGGLLTEAIKDKIRVSGTTVDWEKKMILHLNVKELKLLGIERLFSQGVASLKPMIKAVYANDPWFNDGELLTLAPLEKAYIIPCVKSLNRQLPHPYTFTSWQKIYEKVNKVA